VTISKKKLVTIMMPSQPVWVFYTTWKYILMVLMEFNSEKCKSNMEKVLLLLLTVLQKTIVYQIKIGELIMMTLLLWMKVIFVNQLESSLMIPMQMDCNQLSILPPTLVEMVMNVSVIYQIIHSHRKVDIVILATLSVIRK